jgi:hypothetical protein
MKMSYSCFIASILMLLTSFFVTLVFAATTTSKTSSSSSNASFNQAVPGGAASAQQMVYGPIQFGFIVDVRGGYWGGTTSNFANYYAQCPAGSTPTTASPPAPAGLSAGQLTAAEFIADAVACGCGDPLRCKPNLLGALGGKGGGVWTRAYCVASVTGHMPASYFEATTTTLGTFHAQKLFTKDSSGNAYMYKLDNTGSQSSTGNKFPGMPEVSGAAAFVWTGKNCNSP